MRDIGPTFVLHDRTGEVRGIDWEFNAWGGVTEGLYANWDQDAQVKAKVIEMCGFERYKCSLIIEGGSFHVDGEGTLITTEECLLNPNRNKNSSRADIELQLQLMLNITKIIWIPKGVICDETDVHVDNLCCFVGPAQVVLTWTDDTTDPQYAVSCAALDILSKSTDAKGRTLTVHKLHQPTPLTRQRHELAAPVKTREVNERMAASYVNFFVGNGVVVLPSFEDRFDLPAKQKLEALFPKHTVIQVPGREILLGGGNIHCITQQQCAGRRRTIL